MLDLTFLLDFLIEKIVFFAATASILLLVKHRVYLPVLKSNHSHSA
ncbi:hypothetical protein GCM10027217_22810 [Pseudomaricurvus hydrocarbonicus]